MGNRPLLLPGPKINNMPSKSHVIPIFARFTYKFYAHLNVSFRSVEITSFCGFCAVNWQKNKSFFVDVVCSFYRNT